MEIYSLFQWNLVFKHYSMKKGCMYNDFQQERSKCNMNKKVKWGFSSCLVSQMSLGTITAISYWQQSQSHPWIWASKIALWQVWHPYKFLRALWITWIPMGSCNSASHLLWGPINGLLLIITCGLTALVMLSGLVGGLIKECLQRNAKMKIVFKF